MMAVGYYAILESAMRYKQKNSIKEHENFLVDSMQIFQKLHQKPTCMESKNLFLG